MATSFSALETHPRRWAREKKKALVLQWYLALEKPSIADVDKAARQLGIKRRSFYYYVARVRAGGSTPKGPRPGAAGRGKSPTMLLRYQRERSAGAIHRHAPEVSVALDHVPLEMAISTKAGKAPAYLTVLIDRRSGTILSHFVDTRKPGSHSAAAVLANWAEQPQPACPPLANLVMHRTTGGNWTNLARALRRAGVTCSGRYSARLPMGSVLFERMTQLSSIPMRPKLSEGKLANVITSLPAVSLQEARRIIDEAVGKWNFGRPAGATVSAPLDLREALAGD